MGMVLDNPVRTVHTFSIKSADGMFILSETDAYDMGSSAAPTPKLTLAIAEAVAAVLKSAGVLGGGGAFPVYIGEDVYPTLVATIPA